eukprot:2900778-Pleurochrysis_carterae.AAC.1
MSVYVSVLEYRRVRAQVGVLAAAYRVQACVVACERACERGSEQLYVPVSSRARVCVSVRLRACKCYLNGRAYTRGCRKSGGSGGAEG